jgi:hypothetical protein
LADFLGGTVVLYDDATIGLPPSDQDGSHSVAPDQERSSA